MPKGQPGTSNRYARLAPDALAAAAHLAEDRGKDLDALAIMAEVESRSPDEQEAFRRAYVAQQAEHAKRKAQQRSP